MTMFLQLMEKTVFMNNRKRREKRELAKEGNICSYKDINDGDKSASLPLLSAISKISLFGVVYSLELMH